MTTVKYFFTFVAFIVIVISAINVIPIQNGVIIDEYRNQPDDLVITFMDVGQGDSIFIHYKDKTMIVDCGGWYPNQKEMAYLKQNNIDDIYCVVLTHDHLDHTMAINDIKREHNVYTTYTYDELHRYDLVDFDDNIRIEVINPPVNYTYASENDKSIVLKMEYENVSILLTGDIEHVAEHNIMKSGINTDSDILKVAHHGLQSSSSSDFISSISPEVAIISTEPTRFTSDGSVEKTLNNEGAKIYTTADDGDIIVVINDGKYNIYTFNE